jgi:predicted Zn-dependent protease
MQEILRQAMRFALLASVAVSTALAQSPPPTQDPAKSPPPSEQTQKGQQQPIQQQDTVNPKNSKEDVEAIGNRGVGKGVNFYSLEKEIALGKGLAQEVERSSKLIDDPIVTEYVNRVGQNLVRNSDARVPFTIKVIDSDEVNAFALPGGFFYVNIARDGAARYEERDEGRDDAACHDSLDPSGSGRVGWIRTL